MNESTQRQTKTLRFPQPYLHRISSQRHDKSLYCEVEKLIQQPTRIFRRFRCAGNIQIVQLSAFHVDGERLR